VPVVPISGGTNPSHAFESVLNMENERPRHLVLVMTDGEWTDGVTMNKFNHSNMTKVLIDFEPGREYKPSPSRAVAKGTDEAFVTGDLLDIPRIVESVILDFV